MKLLPIKDRVQKLLENNPHLMDDDRKLVANVWHAEIQKKLMLLPSQLTASNLLHELSGGRLSDYDAITRCRRKLQEENPHLRGKKWAKRHDRQQEVIEELKLF